MCYNHHDYRSGAIHISISDRCTPAPPLHPPPPLTPPNIPFGGGNEVGHLARMLPSLTGRLRVPQVGRWHWPQRHDHDVSNPRRGLGQAVTAMVAGHGLGNVCGGGGYDGGAMMTGIPDTWPRPALAGRGVHRHWGIDHATQRLGGLAGAPALSTVPATFAIPAAAAAAIRTVRGLTTTRVSHNLPDHYGALRIEASATPKEIKSA